MFTIYGQLFDLFTGWWINQMCYGDRKIQLLTVYTVQCTKQYKQSLNATSIKYFTHRREILHLHKYKKIKIVKLNFKAAPKLRSDQPKNFAQQLLLIVCISNLKCSILKFFIDRISCKCRPNTHWFPAIYTAIWNSQEEQLDFLSCCNELFRWKITNKSNGLPIG